MSQEIVNEAVQYRTRRFNGDDWSDWKWLPASLLFNSSYAPLYFEFRWHVMWSEPMFVRKDV